MCHEQINCQTFGLVVSKDLETIYYKLLKFVQNVRATTPKQIILIKSGFLPLFAIIQKRKNDLTRKRVFEIFNLFSSLYLCF